MLPLCILILLIYFVVFAPATRTGSSSLHWGNAISMSVMFGVIPGILLAGVVYTILNIFYPYSGSNK